MVILIKFGGSVITYKNKYKSARKKMVDKLTLELAKVWKKDYKLILVHGAGSFGHAPVVKYKINNGVHTKGQKIGFADTHLAVSELSNLIVKSLIKYNVPAVSLPPAFLFEQNNKKVVRFYSQPIFDYFNEGYLPVLYGDMVLDYSLGGSVLSGDQIMTVLSKAMPVDKMIFITDVEGVLDNNGNVIPIINKDNLSEVQHHLTGSKNVDVTGGMHGKIMEIIHSGVPTVITNSKSMKDAILGKKVGTFILP
ncbi:isopentenyl phosphate kinase family protein [Candidatus Micrarchaeota archaeon]|nr:isopentenyl phosphate kinase family protein [Candidatus Micrarchaeota archaeon]